MAVVRGFYVDRAGRPASGSVTFTPDTGPPVAVRVRRGVMDREDVPAGTYEVTATLRPAYRSDLIPYRPARVTIPASGVQTMTGTPPVAPIPTPGGGDVSVVEVEPGMWEITGPGVVELAPGAYALNV